MGGIVFLGEPMTLRFVLAFVAILGGIALVILEKQYANGAPTNRSSGSPLSVMDFYGFGPYRYACRTKTDEVSMDIFLDELAAGFPDTTQMARLLLRLGAAMVLGAIVGAQREHIGKPAGLRTHILVAMGSALFVIAAVGAGMSLSDMSRVIQGLAAGIGFIGAGAILKLSQEREIQGLTTAAGIWMTAAAGVAAGLGLLGLALLSVILTWFVLTGLGYIETWIKNRKDGNAAT